MTKPSGFLTCFHCNQRTIHKSETRGHLQGYTCNECNNFHSTSETPILADQLWRALSGPPSKKGKLFCVYAFFPQGNEQIPDGFVCLANYPEQIPVADFVGLYEFSGHSLPKAGQRWRGTEGLLHLVTNVEHKRTGTEIEIADECYSLDRFFALFTIYKLTAEEYEREAAPRQEMPSAYPKQKRNPEKDSDSKFRHDLRYSLETAKGRLIQAKGELERMKAIAEVNDMQDIASVFALEIASLDRSWFALRGFLSWINDSHINATCGSCGGPLDEARDSICTRCAP